MGTIRTLRWIPVDSSAIAAISYDRPAKRLHVLFLHGGQYSYEGIGYHRFRKLRDAPSIGKYYNEAIKPTKTEKKAA